MSSFDQASEGINSRTSSGEFEIHLPGLDEQKQEFYTESQSQLRRLLNWFKIQHIQPGDPLSVQEQYLKQGKSRVAVLLNTQKKNQQNCLQSRLETKGKRRLTIEIKF